MANSTQKTPATEPLKVKWQKNGKVTEEHANFKVYHREEKNPREALILIMSSGYVVFDKASDRVQVISSSSQNRNKLKSWKRVKWQGKKELCFERIKPYNLYCK